MTRKICPVCNGKGKIRNPRNIGDVIDFYKDIECPNCNREGFIGFPDNPKYKEKFYRIN